MPVIAMWETLDFRPSSGTKKYKGENDCRKESEHIWQSLHATLIEGYQSLGRAAQTVNDEADAWNQLAGMPLDFRIHCAHFQCCGTVGESGGGSSEE